METIDLEALMTKRRAAALKTLRRVDAREVRNFLDQLFANKQSHPWYKPFHQFVDEHDSDTFLRSEPEPGLTIIYHPGASGGMWCKSGVTLEGVGRLHGRGLATMNEIADAFLSGSSS